MGAESADFRSKQPMSSVQASQPTTPIRASQRSCLRFGVWMCGRSVGWLASHPRSSQRREQLRSSSNSSSTGLCLSSSWGAGIRRRRQHINSVDENVVACAEQTAQSTSAISAMPKTTEPVSSFLERARRSAVNSVRAQATSPRGPWPASPQMGWLRRGLSGQSNATKSSTGEVLAIVHVLAYTPESGGPRELLFGRASEPR